MEQAALGMQCETNLTLNVPIITAADDIHKSFFFVFQRKYDLMFQVNPLHAEGSHEKSSFSFFGR